MVNPWTETKETKTGWNEEICRSRLHDEDIKEHEWKVDGWWGGNEGKAVEARRDRESIVENTDGQKNEKTNTRERKKRKELQGQLNQNRNEDDEGEEEWDD